MKFTCLNTNLSDIANSINTNLQAKYMYYYYADFGSSTVVDLEGINGLSNASHFSYGYGLVFIGSYSTNASAIYMVISNHYIQLAGDGSYTMTYRSTGSIVSTYYHRIRRSSTSVSANPYVMCIWFGSLLDTSPSVREFFLFFIQLQSHRACIETLINVSLLHKPSSSVNEQYQKVRLL